MLKPVHLLIITFVATASVALAAPDKEAIISKEKAAWEAWKSKKVDEFKKMVSADYVEVGAHGVANMDKLIQEMKEMELKSYSFKNTNVVFPDPDTAVLTYTVTLDMKSGGEDQSGDYNAGAVWRQTNGEWKSVFFAAAKQKEAKEKE